MIPDKERRDSRREQPAFQAFMAVVLIAFIALSPLDADQALAQAQLETHPETVESETIAEISYDQSLKFLKEVSARLERLPNRQFIHNDTELKAWAQELVPLYFKLGLVDFQGELTDIHFENFAAGHENDNVLARSFCEEKKIVVNSQFINPKSRWSKRLDLPYVVSHELGHTVAQVCSLYPDGNPYSPPPNAEATSTLIGVEVLSYLYKEGNEAAEYGLLAGLQEVAYRTFLYVSLRDSRMGEFQTQIAVATKDEILNTLAKNTTEQLKNKPDLDFNLLPWSWMYGGSVYSEIKHVLASPENQTQQTFKFDPKHRVLNFWPLSLRNLADVLESWQLVP